MPFRFRPPANVVFIHRTQRLTGAKGDMGPQGPTGPIGDKGDIDPQGIQGATGAKGDTGSAGNGLANGSAAGQIYLTGGNESSYAPQGPQTVTGDVTITGDARTVISNNATTGNNIIMALGSATRGTIPLANVENGKLSVLNGAAST